MYTVLYKLLKREHALRFFENGELRIGTLHEYRRQEVYGPEIGDHGEGTKSTHCVDPVGSAAHLLSHPFISEFFTGVTADSNIFINAQFTRKEESSDLYVYSMMAALVSRAAQQLGYDTYIMIKHPKSYLSCVDKELRQTATVLDGFDVLKCNYVSREQLYSLEHGIFPPREHQVHPATIKDPSYAYQREVRAIWHPSGLAIKPIILYCPEAIQYCEMGDLKGT